MMRGNQKWKKNAKIISILKDFFPWKKCTWIVHCIELEYHHVELSKLPSGARSTYVFQPEQWTSFKVEVELFYSWSSHNAHSVIHSPERSNLIRQTTFLLLYCCRLLTVCISLDLNLNPELLSVCGRERISHSSSTPQFKRALCWVAHGET